MDCRTVRTLIDLGCTRRAGELQPADAQLFDAHLSQCPDCRIFAGAEQQLDTQLVQLGKASSAVMVPVGLRHRLLTKLAAARFDFYRTWTLRIGGVAAVLAAVIVGLVLWLRADPEKLSPLSTLNMFRPTPKEERPDDPDEIPRWFYTTHGVVCQLPGPLRRWNFAFLVDRFVQVEFGHPAPTMFFKKGDSLAKVTVLSRDQFDLDSARALKRSGSRILGDPDRDPSIAIVIIYTGNYEDFLK